MVTRCTSWAYVAAVLLLTGVSTATAKYSGGTGEPNDPYQIATAADLIALGETPEDYDKHFILTADIDLDPNLPGRKVFRRAVIAPDTDPVKSYYQGTSFTGVFDGNGHVIFHLTIKGAAYLGLFGRLGSGAQVKNLGVVGVNTTGSGNYVGGLVGENYQGTASQCYSTGAVRGNNYVGGLVASIGLGGGVATISNCYSTAALSGNSYVGGLVGRTGGGWGYMIVSQCYSTGPVSGTSYAGGLVGDNEGYVGLSVVSCFWDTETSGQTVSAGGTGLTTDKMQDIQTYQGARWDFVGQIEDGTSEIWQMPEGGDYPVLAIFSGYFPLQLRALGTREDPYLISNALELGAIVHYSPHAHYRLTADIDVSEVRWSTAVIPLLAGTFDGDGHIISHLTITGWHDAAGLFGYLESSAEVKNLGVVDVNVTAIGECVGGLVGYNEGTVTGCYSIGAVSGNSSVGGLVGLNGGTITRCYSTGTVSGDSSVGGLVGYNDGTVTRCYSMSMVSGVSDVGGLIGSNGPEWIDFQIGRINDCYSTGAVSGNTYVGGLVGINGGAITQCYSTGAVDGGDTAGGLVGSRGYEGSVISSFWDTQTSGQAASAGGVGRTTAEMQKTSTFRGWATCGNAGVWTINEGNDYPRLWWECQPGETLRMPILPDLLLGTGTEDDPFLIYTAEELNTIGLFPCEWNKHFKLMEDIDLSSFDGKEGRPPFNMIAPGVLGDVSLNFYGTPFTGVFNGNSHTISHLTVMVNDGGCAGLIGGLESGAQIKDLRVIEVNVTSSGNGVGGLAGVLGYSAGVAVTRCYTSGAVRGDHWVGGLVGKNHGIVTQCQSTGAVIAGAWGVGGLVGTNGGAITQCYSTSAVTGTWGVGGLVGSNGEERVDGWCGEVTDCYSTGAVRGTPESLSVGGLVGYWDCGSITRSYSTGSVDGNDYVGGLVGGGYPECAAGCFWDTQTSGQATSGGGTGKTTAEMHTAKTFLDAGWDFVGETANGPNDVWKIAEGLDYPRLWWEAAEE